VSGASPALYPASSSPLLQVPVRLTAGYAPLHAARWPVLFAELTQPFKDAECCRVWWRTALEAQPPVAVRVMAGFGVPRFAACALAHGQLEQEGCGHAARS